MMVHGDVHGGRCAITVHGDGAGVHGKGTGAERDNAARGWCAGAREGAVRGRGRAIALHGNGGWREGADNVTRGHSARVQGKVQEGDRRRECPGRNPGASKRRRELNREPEPWTFNHGGQPGMCMFRWFLGSRLDLVFFCWGVCVCVTPGIVLRDLQDNCNKYSCSLVPWRCLMSEEKSSWRLSKWRRAQKSPTQFV